MKTLVAAVLGGVAACLAVAAAFAHAEPATITPGDGAVLNAVPATIVYEMSQDMARQDGADGQPANNLQVFDASGKQVSTENAVVDDTDRSKLTLKMPASLAVGTYTVKWTTLSADDGDAANGQFTFTYDPSKPPATGTTVTRDTGIGQPAASPTAAPAAALDGGGGGSGTSWVLVMAVAVGMLAVGSGGTFLLIQKRP